MGLNLPRRTKKRLPARVKEPLDAPPHPNAHWSMDFMQDTLYHGKRFRTLNVLDEGVREALAIEVDTSLPAERVIRVLEQLKDSRPLPRQIRVVITARSSSLPSSSLGVNSTKSIFITSNQANRLRMLTSNVSTGPTAGKYSMLIFLDHSKKCERSLITG